MIESLTLENFQAHAKLTLELDPRVTTIVGPSDRGKSTVLRALKWVCLNAPAGDAFVRKGAKGATVILRIDGHEIIRTKTLGIENAYRIDGKRFVAFGAQVPGELSILIGAGPLNFQGQHDAPFWFSQTAGEVARQLNAIIDLGAIDSTLANLDRAARNATARADVGRERAASAKAARAATAKAEEMDDALRVVEASEKAWEEIERNRSRIAILVKTVSEYREGAERALERRERALAAVAKGERWGRLAGRASKLGELVSYITQLTKQRERLRAEARSARQELKQAIGERCPLCQQEIIRS